jgi:hypothetical protein
VDRGDPDASPAAADPIATASRVEGWWNLGRHRRPRRTEPCWRYLRWGQGPHSCLARLLVAGPRASK